MIRRVLSAVVLVALGALLLVAAWPQLLGIQREAIVVQATTLRGLLAGVALLGVVLSLAIAIAAPGARRFAGAVAVLLLAFAAVQAAVLATRGWGREQLVSKQPGDLTVVSWNTLGEEPGVEEVAELALGAAADVVVLPETSRAFAEQVARAMAVGGADMRVFAVAYDEISKARSTAVLVSTELGDYRVDDTVGGTETLPSVVLVPADGTGPTIVGAHPVAPVPGEMAAWRQGLAWLAQRCSGDDVILAGDLNSTLDHYTGLDPASDRSGGIGGCRDGARVTGSAAVGTWPTSLPPVLGAPIDHVMATPTWDFVAFRVDVGRDHAGSDHRPVIAHLRPAG